MNVLFSVVLLKINLLTYLLTCVCKQMNRDFIMYDVVSDTYHSAPAPCGLLRLGLSGFGSEARFTSENKQSSLRLYTCNITQSHIDRDTSESFGSKL